MVDIPKAEISAAGLLLLFVGAILRGVFVPGWVYRKLAKEKDALQRRYDILEKQDQALRMEIAKIREIHKRMQRLYPKDFRDH